jgi:phage terminase large subunit
MTAVNLQIAKVFEPLLSPSRYKGAFGGRGSGKSHLFAQLMLVKALAKPGFRGVCIREYQKSLKESSKKLVEDKMAELGLDAAQGFEVRHDHIRTPHGGSIIFTGLQDANAESIKSLEGIDVAWVEEAQTITSRSLALLRPTVRNEGSELWFSWNARRRTDPIDVLLRGDKVPTDAIVIQANWSDNPFFPAVLEQERIDCLTNEPDQYEHIWEGSYATILVGAYYAQDITKARSDGRISHVAPDPLLPIKLAWDIGGTGAKSDSCSIWAFQLVGKEIRVVDYYEAQGQPLATHVAWLRGQGYHPHDAQCYLPHDGVQGDKVFAVSYQSALEDAGYFVTVVPNQGKGAAKARIETARRVFGSVWFNQSTTQGGIDALGWYHSKQDDTRGIDLGPEHDWSSHAADAFGLLCIVAQEEQNANKWQQKLDYARLNKGKF